MLPCQKLKDLMNTIGFELGLSDTKMRINLKNPLQLLGFLNDLEYGFKNGDFESNDEVDLAIEEIKKILSEHETKVSPITKEQMKQVYVMLKERQLHPKGEFDKQGRFYLEDHELVNVRTPSAKYPYSQMNAGRTSKFVQSIVDKYKPQTFEELLSCFRTGG